MITFFHNKSPFLGTSIPNTEYISIQQYINLILNRYCFLETTPTKKSNNFQKYYLSPHPL